MQPNWKSLFLESCSENLGPTQDLPLSNIPGCSCDEQSLALTVVQAGCALAASATVSPQPALCYCIIANQKALLMYFHILIFNFFHGKKNTFQTFIQLFQLPWLHSQFVRFACSPYNASQQSLKVDCLPEQLGLEEPH